MEVLSWIVVGVATGSMARAVMPGPAGRRNVRCHLNWHIRRIHWWFTRNHFPGGSVGSIQILRPQFSCDWIPVSAIFVSVHRDPDPAI